MGVNRGLAPVVGSYFFHKDGLGSVIEITNSSGNIIQHFVYSSFGKILKIVNGSVDNTQNPLIKTNFAYTNREYDSESGLYYYRARYYDAHIGRFLQEDPHPGVLDSPLSYHSKYSYVLGNPINGTDPNGKILPLLLVGFFVGGLSNAIFAKEGSFAANFLTGAIVGTISAGVGIGVGAAFSSFLGAGLGASVFSGAAGVVASSAISQLIMTGKISWQLLVLGGVLGGIGGAVGYATGAADRATQTTSQKAAESIDAANKGFINGAAESTQQGDGLIPKFLRFD